jgi:hypothetical protein
MQSLAAKNPSWMSFNTANFLSEEGNPFPYALLSTGNSSERKLRVWIQGEQGYLTSLYQACG